MENPISVAPYWVSLDSLVDVERLVGLHEQFCFAVARSVRNPGGYGAFHSSENYLSGKLKEFFALPADDPLRVRCAGMNIYELGLYIGLLHEGLAVSETVNITVPRGIFAIEAIGLKHCQEQWRPSTNYPLYKFLFDWLHDQKIFSSYGRVYGFLNCPYQMEIPHVDMEEPDKPCDFIWFRTSLSKPFFVQPYRDCSPTERSYVDGHVVWFNPGMWHCAGTTEHYAISFRIDGVFARDFRDRIYQLRK
jgi:hypothetical protein